MKRLRLLESGALLRGGDAGGGALRLAWWVAAGGACYFAALALLGWRPRRMLRIADEMPCVIKYVQPMKWLRSLESGALLRGGLPAACALRLAWWVAAGGRVILPRSRCSAGGRATCCASPMKWHESLNTCS